MISRRAFTARLSALLAAPAALLGWRGAKSASNPSPKFVDFSAYPVPANPDATLATKCRFHPAEFVLTPSYPTESPDLLMRIRMSTVDTEGTALSAGGVELATFMESPMLMSTPGDEWARGVGYSAFGAPVVGRVLEVNRGPDMIVFHVRLDLEGNGQRFVHMLRNGIVYDGAFRYRVIEQGTPTASECRQYHGPVPLARVVRRWELIALGLVPQRGVRVMPDNQ